jgi:hypothetical protein
MEITLSELLKAVEGAQRGGDGFTINELREACPMGERRARDIVRRAIAQGLVRVSRKVITTLSGDRKAVPSYVIVKRGSR